MFEKNLQKVNEITTLLIVSGKDSVGDKND